MESYSRGRDRKQTLRGNQFWCRKEGTGSSIGASLFIHHELTADLRWAPFTTTKTSSDLKKDSNRRKKKDWTIDLGG